MKIMEIVSGTRVNGAILHCLLLSRELVRRGHQVTLVCRPGSWISRQMVDGPIDAFRSDLHRWPPDELRRIAGVIRQRQIDVIHTHTSRANFFGILLRWMTGVPSVATAHSRHVQLHWMFNDRVIAVSEADRRYQRTHNLVRGSRIETIHNFIDCQPHAWRCRPTPAAGSAPGWASARPRRAAGHRRQHHSAQGADPPGPRPAEGRLPPCRTRGWWSSAATRKATMRSGHARTARRLGVASRHQLDRPTERCPRDCCRPWISTCCRRLKRAFPFRSWRPWRPDCRWWPRPWAACPSAWSPDRRACWCRPAIAMPWPQAIIDLATAPQRRRDLGEAGGSDVLQAVSRPRARRPASRPSSPASSVAARHNLESQVPNPKSEISDS